MTQAKPLSEAITVQANILSGRPRGYFAHYNFLHFPDATSIKAFIGALVDLVPTWVDQKRAADREGNYDGIGWLNLALTCAGVDAAAPTNYLSSEKRREQMLTAGYPSLGWSADAPADAFDHPMRHRLPLLGETADDWSWGPGWVDPTYIVPPDDGSLPPAPQPMHVLAWITGTDRHQVDVVKDAVEAARDAQAGVTLLELDGKSPNLDGTGHFGFIDGTSQPAIEVVHDAQHRIDGNGALRLLKDGTRKWTALPPGEFVTGLTRADDDGSVIGDEGYELRNPEPTGLLEHCTYMAFRQIEMNKGAWEGVRDSLAAALGGVSSAEAAARLVGRKPGLGGDEDPHLLGDTSNKIFYSADPEGDGCPLGAHVRRANPRDAMGFDGARVNRHRIIRRGLPYEKGGKKGLAFIALQARLEDGFEFIQRHWLNEGSALHLGADPDPIAGNPLPDVDQPRFVHQGDPTCVVPLEPIEQPQNRVTVVRGGEYFVLPTKDGLQTLAAN